MGVIRDNRTNIVSGGIISASYVSDVYNVLTGNTVEQIAFTGSVSVTGSLIGTLTGTATTASYAVTAVSASYSNTASFSLTSVSSSYAVTSSYVSGSTLNATSASISYV